MSRDGCAISVRNNRRRIFAMACLAAGVLTARNVVCAQIPCSYDVQIIASSNDCGGFGTVNTFGLGLNENGAVVGYYKCPLWNHTEAFLWTAEEGFVTLQRPQGVSSAFAVDINDDGVICGIVFVSGLDTRGFVYENGVWTILPPVVDVPGARSSANAINNAGIVVGQRSLTEELNPQNAYMWSVAEGFRDLEGLEELSGAIDINGNLITGWTANPGEMKEGFLWDDGQATLLGPIPGGISSTGNGINAMEQICGFGVIEMKEPPNIGVGFVWDDGVFTLIDPIRSYDTSGSGDINDQGYVTGLSANLDQPTDLRGFVWIDGTTHDLNDFIPDKLTVLVKRAKAISNAGQIVSDGDHQGMDSVTFLLTPVAAPLGDLDGDCIVGARDLLILLTEWGQRDSPADLNGDGMVGAADLLILLVNWGSK